MRRFSRAAIEALLYAAVLGLGAAVLLQDTGPKLGLEEPPPYVVRPAHGSDPSVTVEETRSERRMPAVDPVSLFPRAPALAPGPSPPAVAREVAREVEPTPWLGYVGVVRRDGTEFHYFKNRRSGQVVAAVLGEVRGGYRLSRRPDGGFVLSWDGVSYLVGGEEPE